jgi:hypothetical protein
MRVPAELYQPSMRKWKGPPEQVSYPGMATRRVKKTGAIGYEDQRVFISQALAGWDLGLGYRREQMLEVYFAQFLLGVLETPTAALVPITAMQSASAAALSLWGPGCRNLAFGPAAAGRISLPFFSNSNQQIKTNNCPIVTHVLNHKCYLCLDRATGLCLSTLNN